MTEEFVQGDTAPDIDYQLKYSSGENAGEPVDLTDSTVAFQMRKPDDRRYTVNAAAEIIDEVDGRVRYTWGDNDLSVSGAYQGQFEITFPDGKIQTIKTPISIEVRRQ